MVFQVDGMVVRLGSHTYAATSVALKTFIVLMMIDAIIEASLVCSSIGWLNDVARGRVLRFVTYGSKYRLPALPRHLIRDPLHTSNGAAGTAFAFVGLGGLAVLTLRDWAQYRTGTGPKCCRIFYYLWVSANTPALFFTGATMVYVLVLSNTRAGQKIHVQKAVNLHGRPYDLDDWPPDVWFSAVLDLKLTQDRGEIAKQLGVMRAWIYNLPLMFLFQSTVTVLGYMDYNRWTIKPRAPGGVHY
ncbi:hypothetical protein F4803DRAFT_555134 [Xylaria telfairii]|nr:hypothetical protein F4803DRAFT_555134 [Xylaria telfairii]